MIYITGDTHGVHPRLAKYQLMQAQGYLKEDDYLIICGDFGYLFNDDATDNRVLDMLEQEDHYQILFIDGNHENFKALFLYPEEQWKGGRVHRIRKNIRHLMRGQVFDLDGTKVFTFGGAYSIDRYLRQKDVSYWEEEIPTVEEYREALLNLEKHNNEVDLVITHTCPSEIIRMMGHYPDRHDEELTGFLEYIMHDVLKGNFKYWCFGHWHIEKWINDKIRAVYCHTLKFDGETLIDLDEGE